MNDRHDEQPVSARRDADPFIGDGGIAASDGIDGDKLRIFTAFQLAKTHLDGVGIMILRHAEHQEISCQIPVRLAKFPEGATNTVQPGRRHIDRAEATMGGKIPGAILLGPPAGETL